MMTFVRNCLADCADLAGLGDSFQVGPVVEWAVQWVEDLGFHDREQVGQHLVQRQQHEPATYSVRRR